MNTLVAPFQTRDEEIDFELLATYLKALGHPARLRLLWELRAPRSAADVALRPARKDDLGADRDMSRQSVGVHLEKLEEAGVVVRIRREDGGADRWATSIPHVFALVEEMRKLTAIPSFAQLDLEETAFRHPDPSTEWPRGPKLVLLTGPWEGRVFPLHGEGPWTIGRSRARSIALLFDPFVSAEHVEVRRSAGRYEVTTQPDARNPVRVNFVTLAPGALRELRHGDVIRVGRSLLLLHGA